MGCIKFLFRYVHWLLPVLYMHLFVAWAANYVCDGCRHLFAANSRLHASSQAVSPRRICRRHGLHHTSPLDLDTYLAASQYGNCIGLTDYGCRRHLTAAYLQCPVHHDSQSCVVVDRLERYCLRCKRYGYPIRSFLRASYTDRIRRMGTAHYHIQQQAGASLGAFIISGLPSPCRTQPRA